MKKEKNDSNEDELEEGKGNIKRVEEGKRTKD